MTGTVNLTATKGGIDRQRTDGSPSPDMLYDLLNGYRNESYKAVVRPGSRSRFDLLAGVTKGFCMFQGSAYVFSHELQTVPNGVICEVITHPTIPGLPIQKIHFAGPFLRFLYVVAEFITGDVFHYWLQGATTWAANTNQALGSLVQPTNPNGYVYQASRIGDPNPLWTANAPRTVGDKVEPTTPDGNFYTVVDTLGTAPRSGATEPVWNTPDGALTYEDVEGAAASTGAETGPSTPDNSQPADGNDDRYGNMGGVRFDI